MKKIFYIPLIGVLVSGAYVAHNTVSATPAGEEPAREHHEEGRPEREHDQRHREEHGNPDRRHDEEHHKKWWENPDHDRDDRHPHDGGGGRSPATPVPLPHTP